jgi:hypothetical protein
VGVSLVIILLLYFVPIIVAVVRHHHNALAIGMLNFFLGWTFIGWVAALVWACTAVRPAGPVAPMSNPVAASPSGEHTLTLQRYDAVTRRPILGYDPNTGAPILGERTQP